MKTLIKTAAFSGLIAFVALSCSPRYEEVKQLRDKILEERARADEALSKARTLEERLEKLSLETEAAARQAASAAERAEAASMAATGAAVQLRQILKKEVQR